MPSLKDYETKRTNIITSIQNDYEMLDTWEYKEFVPLDKLSQGDRLIVTLCGFPSVHDMLEDTRRTIERKKKGLKRVESKIDKLKNE